MSVKVTHKVVLDSQNINKLVHAQKMALRMTADALLSELIEMQVIPKDKGDLERSGFVDESQLERFVVAVVFDTPYARRLYWNPEYNFRDNPNVNAQGKWMHMFIDGERKGWVEKTYMHFFKQQSKGLIK